MVRDDGDVERAASLPREGWRYQYTRRSRARQRVVAAQSGMLPSPRCAKMARCAQHAVTSTVMLRLREVEVRQRQRTFNATQAGGDALRRENTERRGGVAELNVAQLNEAPRQAARTTDAARVLSGACCVARSAQNVAVPTVHVLPHNNSQ